MWSEPPETTAAEKAKASKTAEWYSEATHEIFSAAYRAADGHVDLMHMLLKQAARLAEFGMITKWAEIAAKKGYPCPPSSKKSKGASARTAKSSDTPPTPGKKSSEK